MKLHKFTDIELSDPFFNSLKEDYPSFSEWYEKKSKEGAKAYIQRNEIGLLQAFLYLKIETEDLSDINPPMPAANRLKVGTFKIDAHNTKLGESFIKKIMVSALYKNVDEIYVTIFSKHEGLIRLLQKYGFVEYGKKGIELVLVKSMNSFSYDILKDYPFIHTTKQPKYILAINPEYHTQLFPDSILNTEQREKDFLVRDVTYTNSIHKVYVCKMKDAANLQKGNIILIYRTNDGAGPAYYRSVITSICVVEEAKKATEFSSSDAFIKYANAYSIFDEQELRKRYNQPNTVVIRMTYNAAFNRRVVRKELLENIGLSADKYWGFLQLTDEQFNNIISKGNINESLIIN